MEQYLIYLRKSRQDRQLEAQTGRTDTLARHRRALLELAESRGYTIVHIYEEVASGDTIAQRPQMRRLLAAVESGAFAGVLVMEIPRLARGSTRDQGVVAETFLYSGTKIITPDRIYDPADEADAEYFEFGLFMSRREYQAINRRLQRGRMAALSEGRCIAAAPPYGYRRVPIPHQRGYTLEPLPETAAVVREIFRLYTAPAGDGDVPGSGAIARLLNGRGIPSPGGRAWTASAVRDVLKNPAYAGYLRWGHRPGKKRMAEGQILLSHPVDHDAPLRRGLHPPLVSEATWQAAQAQLSRRAHPPLPGSRPLSNPLAGLVRCTCCGRLLTQLPRGRHSPPTLLCPTSGCPTVSSRRDVVERAVVEALARALAETPFPREETPPDAPPLTWQDLPRLYGLLDTPAQQNALLKLLLHHVDYRKNAGGCQSDLTLTLYPRFPPRL